jgi:glycerol kinase
VPKKYLLAIDQGTTSCRSIVFNLQGQAVYTAQQKLGQEYPQSAWVQQDLEVLWQTQLATIKECLNAVDPNQIAAIGITNQRETIGLWNKQGEALTPAISWQCQRTEGLIGRFSAHEERIRQITGLPLNPYFSASKLAWLLQNNPNLNLQELLAGTVDTWLLYKLTAGKAFLTDPSNACRTLLFNLEQNDWSDELLDLFGIPGAILPKVVPSQSEFGLTDKAVLGHQIPICGMIGDQQAALYGHACLEPKMAELTCGTGGFLLFNSGAKPHFTDGLLSSVAWQLSGHAPVYTQEAAILSVGSMLEWLNRLGLIQNTFKIDETISQAAHDADLMVMPALTGFGSPNWSNKQRASILNLGPESAGPEILKATIEGIAFRVKQVILLIDKLIELRLGGGLARSNYFCQLLANTLELKISRSANIEATAWGAASIAHMGFTPKELKNIWHAQKTFQPQLEGVKIAQEKWSHWSEAFACC